MNKNLKMAYSSIMMLVLLTTVFSPFAYAKHEKASMLTRVNIFAQEAGEEKQECENVWVEELDWKEYQTLLNSTIKRIDAWGNKELGEREKQLEENGLASNPEATNLKDYYIPGVDGRPALLYDVLNKKAVDPNQVCHLSNLVTSSRIAYSTRIKEPIRYCAGQDPACEEKSTASEVEEISDVVNKLSKLHEKAIDGKVEGHWLGWNSLLEAYDKSDLVRQTANELGYSRAQIEEWINNEDSGKIAGVIAEISSYLGSKISAGPQNFAEANEIEFLTNSDAAFLFPGTYLDFINFIRSFKPLDDAILIMTLFDMAIGAAQVANSARTALSKGGMLSKIKNFLRYGRGNGVKIMAEGLDEAKPLWQQTDDLAKSWKDFTKAAEKMGDKVGPNNPKYVNSIDDLIDQVRKMDIGRKEELINALEGLKGDYSKAGEVRNLISQIKEANKPPKAIGDRIREAIRLRRQTITRGVPEKPEVGAGRLRRLGYVVGYGSTVFTNFVRLMFGNAFKGVYGWLLVQYSRVNFFTTASIWLKNKLVSGVFQANIMHLELNTSTKNFAYTHDLQHWLEVRTTVSRPDMAKYYSNLWNLMPFVDIKGTGDKVSNKIKSIQDIVVIYDQDAYAEKNKRPVNVIRVNGREWDFFSSYDDSSVIYNFEHPSGYYGGGLSALAMRIKNVNVGGILAESSSAFSYPLAEKALGAGYWFRGIRNALGVATLLSAAPAGAYVAVNTVSITAGVITEIIVGLLVFEFGGSQKIYDQATASYGYFSNPKEIYSTADPQKICKNIFESEKGSIKRLKWTILAFTTISLGGTLTGFAPAAIIGSIGQMAAMHIESEKEANLANALKNCVETDFEAVLVKNIPSSEEVQETNDELFKPVEDNALKVLDAFSMQGLNDFLKKTASLKVQVLNINGELYDNNTVRVVGREIYNVHFKDGTIKWFQGPDCNIQLCEQEASGAYACFGQNGYFLLDEDGNPLLDGIPQALSMRMNLEEGYDGLVQKVINIKQNDNEMMKISSDWVSISDSCLLSSISEVTKIPVEQLKDVSVLSSKLGDFDAVYSPEAFIWIEGGKVNVLSYEDKKCEGGDFLGKGEVFRFDSDEISFTPNSEGTIRILDSDGNTLCSFKLNSEGSEGVINFENAMLRKGFYQSVGEDDNKKEVDYSDVYHLFIYDLLSFQASNLEYLSIEDMCSIDPETGQLRGVKLIGGLGGYDSAYSDQLSSLLQDICFNEFKGLNNEHVSIRDGKLCVVDSEGNEECYDIEGVSDGRIQLSNGYSMGAGVDDSGIPYLQLYDANGNPYGARIPLLWATGLGGTMMYNPNTGSISIKNEFPFAINPLFKNYGAGGLGLMTPQLPPWGGRAKETTEGGKPQPSIIARLPWTPENNLMLAVFVTIILMSVLMIRRKVSKS